MVQLPRQLGNCAAIETEYGSYLGPNKALYLRNRTSGKQIGNQRPVVLRFKVVRLRKEGFIHIEGPVIFMVFVPFVLRIVYLAVRRRSCKVELRRNSTVSLDSPNETRQSPHSGRSVQCHLISVNIPLKEREGEGTVFLMELRAQG
jgi:hypothetical protein